MSKTTNELILNPDFYSANSYIEQEENAKPIYVRVFIQLLIMLTLLGVLIFSYKYFMQNYYEEIRLWIIEDTVSTHTVKKESIIPKIIEVKVEKKNIVKVFTQTKAEIPIVQHQELSDEYIKLVEQSLGNY
jgi:hypothetical protein